MGDLMTGKPAPVNGGRNYNGPKVAKGFILIFICKKLKSRALAIGLGLIGCLKFRQVIWYSDLGLALF